MNDGADGSMLALLVPWALILIVIVSLWKVFTKAGQPGWGALIPIYNMYLLCKVAGKRGYWVVLMFIPFVNIIIGILVAIGVAENFEKGKLFGIGLFFLPFIFYPLLAFSDARYWNAPESI